jgi:hypothetical protein
MNERLAICRSARGRMTRKRLGLGAVAVSALAVVVVTLTAGGSPARPSATANQTAFQPCRPGKLGGGYRVRINGISCREVRRLLPKMFAGAKRIERRESESVYRTRRGFTCLVQAGPAAAPPYTVILCVRQDQTIFYRAA